MAISFSLHGAFPYRWVLSRPWAVLPGISSFNTSEAGELPYRLSKCGGMIVAELKEEHKEETQGESRRETKTSGEALGDGKSVI